MKTGFTKYILVKIFTFVIVLNPAMFADAMSGRPDPGSCRGIKLCKSIEGTEFDMIKYYALGTELVILYDKHKSGEIYPTSDESLYERSKGTVNDAIRYLSGNLDYQRFVIRKAWKATGFFKSKRIDSAYVVLPMYSSGEKEAPEYGFFEKNGELRVSITPIRRSYQFFKH